MTSEDPIILLNITCADRIGIVADVSRFLAENSCNIVESAQFEDPLNRTFFMRVAFRPEGTCSLDSLTTGFAPVAERYAMAWRMVPRAARMPTLIMVSKFGHCLNDLLFRHRIGALPIDLRMIVSNHDSFAGLAQASGIPFVHLPVTSDTKPETEARLVELIEDEGIELLVLARYMQVLSDRFCARYPGQIINIHHSLLPSFKGAKPYHRAHERGVKLIGATAHYVTADLDEGPIIEQGVAPVRHNMSPEDLIAKGREVETSVLSTAVQLHAERRVFLNGPRTVVF